MFNEYALFDIRIRATAPESYAIDVRSALGGDASGSFTPPTNDQNYQRLADQLRKLDISEDELTELGQILFRSLFQGAIKDVYARSQGKLTADQGIRLRFDIDPTLADIAGLPWEFLNDPDQGPLALLDAPIVRYLSQQAAPPTLPAPTPLKVLVTGAVTPPAPEVERELAEVRAALEDLEDQGLVSLQIEPHLTQATLQRRLREGFHIWHFIGHGGSSRDGRSGTLMFEDGSGSSKSVSASELNILLNRSGVRLILLDACGSGEIRTDSYRSVAPALIRAQVPAVIAMQLTVPQEATRAFAGEFYRALAEGFPIDACVTEGRKAVVGVSGLRNPDWGIPVVYTRAPDGKLFDRPAAAPIGSPPQQSGVNIAIGGQAKLEDSNINVSNVGNTVTGSSSAIDQEERAEQIATLQELIKANRRRLNQRQLQAAKYGIGADPSISIEIEDLSKEIAKLERELKALGG